MFIETDNKKVPKVSCTARYINPVTRIGQRHLTLKQNITLSEQFKNVIDKIVEAVTIY